MEDTTLKRHSSKKRKVGAEEDSMIPTKSISHVLTETFEYDQDDNRFIISDKLQKELQNIVNDTNIRDIFFGKDNDNNQNLYIIVNNIPTEPLRIVENFPVIYIEWGTFTEKIPRNNPPQKSFPLNIKQEFNRILDTHIGLDFRSKYCNLVALSLGWKITDRYYTEKPAIVFYVIRKGVIPIGNELFPKIINGIDTDVREGFYEPTGFVDSEYCRKYSSYVSSGCSIGICNSSRAGTLGAFVKNSNGHICLLSSYHVLHLNDRKNIEHIIEQPAYADHIGAIKKKIEGEKELLNRANVYNNTDEVNEKTAEIESLKSKLETAKNKDTKFAIYVDGKRGNYIVDRSNYGVDAAIASLEPIDNNKKRYIQLKDFAIPKFAFEEYSLTTPFQISGIIKDINSIDISKPIFKVGRTTGLSEGRFPDLIVISFNSISDLCIYKHQLSILGEVQMEEVNGLVGKTKFQPIWLDRQIVVLGKHNKPFMDDGDSGCIWFDKNGMIIALGHGVFIKNASIYAVGSPINAVLNALKVELYLG